MNDQHVRVQVVVHTPLGSVYGADAYLSHEKQMSPERAQAAMRFLRESCDAYLAALERLYIK